MVYPNQVIENRNWTDNTGIGILLALGENDGLHIYNTSFDNELELGMPQEVVNCEVRVRGISGDPLNLNLFPALLMQFYLGGNLVNTAIILTTTDWVNHTLTVDRWDSVLLEADVNGTVAVDFLRAEPYGGAPTKRTLTGVGI